MFYWDEQDNTLCACDGSSWGPLDAASAASCS